MIVKKWTTVYIWKSFKSYLLSNVNRSNTIYEHLFLIFQMFTSNWMLATCFKKHCKRCLFTIINGETRTTWVFVGNETSFLASARSSKATVMHMTWSWRTWSLPSLPVLSALCPWPTTPWSCVWEWSSTAVNGSVSHDTQSGTWNFNQTIYFTLHFI